MARAKATLEEIFGLIAQLRQATKSNPLGEEEDDYGYPEEDYDGLQDNPSVRVYLDDNGKPTGGIYITDDYDNEIEGTLNSVRTELEGRIKRVNNRPPVLQVANVGDYTAKVSETGIRVGCQEVSFTAFDALAEAVAKVRPQPKAKKAKK